MNFPRRLLSALAVTAAAALTLAACSSGGSDAPAGGNGDTGSAELTTLKVATVGLVSDGALIAGIEQGFFEEEGLEIETSIVANPPAALAAAQGGQVDIAYSPSVPLINALSQGVDLRIVAGADALPDDGSALDNAQEFDDTGLFASAASGITSVEDLAGKTISVPARKAQMEVVIAAELEDAGIDPVSGVNWVALDNASAVAALQNGTIDAAGIVSPFTAEAEAAGQTYLSSPSVAFFERGAVGLWVAGGATVENEADAVAAFQRAIAKANQFANENPEVATQAGLDYTGSELGVEDVKRPVWPTEVRVEDIQRPVDRMVTLGFLTQPIDISDVIVPTS